MYNKQENKTPMPTQDADIRNKNFEEVSLGYTLDMAVNEANRCIDCKHKPCVQGCPINIDIPAFINHIKSNDIKSAFDSIKTQNALPAVCGRVCPQENQCEKNCVRAKKGESVAIGRLEMFCADWARENDIKSSDIKEKQNKKVAVIGAGPAGLSCAGILAKNGVEVEIFESLHKAGGVLMYGIPEFRLPKSIVNYEIDNLKELGVKISTDTIVGKTVTVNQLENQGFSAFFIGSGAGLPSFMGIKGENFANVLSANEYLTRFNLMEAYKEESDTPNIKYNHVVVVGGGNVAMDAARVAKRNGSKVSIVYRRSEKEMPARLEEIHHAKEEGIEFLTLNNPVEIFADEKGRVNKLQLIKMDRIPPANEGERASVKAIEGSEYLLDVDCVIMAIGTNPNPILKSSLPELELTRRGGFKVDDNMRTSKENIWAGGDAVTGAATVIEAMGAGTKAASSILEYLK